MVAVTNTVGTTDAQSRDDTFAWGKSARKATSDAMRKRPRNRTALLWTGNVDGWLVKTCLGDTVMRLSEMGVGG